MTQYKKCMVCEKVFEKKINCSKKQWGTVKFCSRECQVKGRVYLKPRWRFKKGSIPWNKGMIGVCFNTGRTHIKKGQKLSPSTQFQKGNEPWSKGKKLLYNVGPLNNNWKGGITSLVQKIRHSPEIKQWRKDVFKRDNYTCVKCGRKRKPGDRVLLEADHIKPFAKYPELRFDLNNGRTLCRECHLKEPTHGVNATI